MAVEQTASLKNIRIGDVLKESGYVNDEQIGQALRYQKEHKGMRLGGALIELGFMTNSAEDRYMASASGQKEMVKGMAAGIHEYFGY